MIANVASHVQDYTFWNYDGVGTLLPASWVAAWSTYAEMSDSTWAKAFHAAGGRYAVAYTDPNLFYTSSNYTDPGNYPSNAFGHGSNGVRTHRPEGPGTAYYLLPNSSGSKSGYQGITQNIAAGGGFNYIYADGVNDTLADSLYHFTPTPVEITTNAQYVSGMKALFSASALPVIVNGYMNGSPITNEQYVGASNVGAMFGESCFSTYSNTIVGSQWLDMANALLYTTSRGTPAICGARDTLSDTRAGRIYWLASWWLTYDSNHSVALELVSSSSAVYLFPEEMLVPTNPLQTAASNDIADLRSSTGAYIRQFGDCYYDRIPWGACAAIVNPTSSSVGMPSAASGYHHALALNLYNLFEGGAASLTTSVPGSLSPGSAAVLFK